MELTPEAAAALLGIDRADLSDPTLRFTTPAEVSRYARAFKARHETDYRSRREDANQAFARYMQEEVGARTEDLDPEDMPVPVGDIIIGHELYRTFASALGHLFTTRVKQYAEEQWDRIEPLFIA